MMETRESLTSIIPARTPLIESLKKTAFIIGSILLVFAAARNTVTWHLQRFWGASGDFWQRQYDWSYQLFGATDFKVAVIGTYLVTTGFYWALNLLYILLDLTGRPKFLLRYKIQPEKNAPLDPKRLLSAVIGVGLNNLVTFPFMVAMFHMYRWRGCQFNGDLPTFHWVLVEICVFTLVEEAMFYYSHRILHYRLFYRHIHKKHHEWTAPIGVISLYCHPVEHVVSNLLPPAMGPLLMGSHIATAWLWYCLALWSTINAHSGYHFPLLPSPEAHDFHHYNFVNNFGVLGVLDRLHGTDNFFRDSIAYKRHMTFLTMVPPRELFPDEKKTRSSTIGPPLSSNE